MCWDFTPKLLLWISCFLCLFDFSRVLSMSMTAWCHTWWSSWSTSARRKCKSTRFEGSIDRVSTSRSNSAAFRQSGESRRALCLCNDWVCHQQAAMPRRSCTKVVWQNARSCRMNFDPRKEESDRIFFKSSCKSSWLLPAHLLQSLIWVASELIMTYAAPGISPGQVSFPRQSCQHWLGLGTCHLRSYCR